MGITRASSGGGGGGGVPTELKVKKVSFDTSTDGMGPATYTLGLTIPNASTVINVSMRITEGFVEDENFGDPADFVLHLEADGDLYPALDSLSSHIRSTGWKQPTGTVLMGNSATWVTTTAARAITLRLGPMQSGKFDMYVWYY